MLIALCQSGRLQMRRIVLWTLLVSASVLLGTEVPGSVVTLTAITKYDRLAALARIAGKVRLVCHIGSTGRVSEVEIREGNALLARQAVLNAKEWRFVPSGEHSTVELYYEFRLVDPPLDYDKTRFSFTFPNRVLVESNYPVRDHVKAN